MTEHSKIPLPGSEPEKDGKGTQSRGDSLFERASGAFGFDAFRPAPVPRALDDPPMKRAKRVERKKPDTAGGKADDQAGQAPASKIHDRNAPPVQEYPAEKSTPADIQDAPQAGNTMPVPVSVAPNEITLVQGVEPVVFSGEKHRVDRALLKKQGFIVPESAVSGLLEEFRIVKRQLLGTAHSRGTAASRRVLVCSALPGEGKSFCATNLAISMAAERDSEVLLVDADIAKPSVLSVFGLPKGPGLMDVLADPSLRIEDCIIGTDIPGLWILPAGSHTKSDSELLASGRTGALLDQLTMGSPNRIVIFDSPPVLAASPAAELAKHIGQTVLVARADRTGQRSLEDAYQLLSACPDIKLLLNAAHFSPSGRRFGSYYGYEG
ncbi:MAG: P-loop NTPase [Sphingomonadaceae bacterium]